VISNEIVVSGNRLGLKMMLEGGFEINSFL
jgi:hypothetical protein